MRDVTNLTKRSPVLAVMVNFSGVTSMGDEKRKSEEEEKRKVFQLSFPSSCLHVFCVFVNFFLV